MVRESSANDVQMVHTWNISHYIDGTSNSVIQRSHLISVLV